MKFIFNEKESINESLKVFDVIDKDIDTFEGNKNIDKTFKEGETKVGRILIFKNKNRSSKRFDPLEGEIEFYISDLEKILKFMKKTEFKYKRK